MVAVAVAAVAVAVAAVAVAVAAAVAQYNQSRKGLLGRFIASKCESVVYRLSLCASYL